MVIKLLQRFEELKIGVLGFRQNLLNLPTAIHLEDETQIDDTFDIVFVSGYHKIIPEEILNKPTYGIFCIHETPLPEGKGSAPIYWTVINGRPNIVITCFKADKKIDNGLIVYQHNIPITSDMGYKELEEARQEGVRECFNIVLDEFREGIIVLREQTGQGSYQKKRKPEDSELIKWVPLIDLWDNIRTCDNDKFPAFFILDDNTKVYLRYEIEKGNFKHQQHDFI